jgi:hypothetical protein
MDNQQNSDCETIHLSDDYKVKAKDEMKKRCRKGIHRLKKILKIQKKIAKMSRYTVCIYGIIANSLILLIHDNSKIK